VMARTAREGEQMGQLCQVIGSSAISAVSTHCLTKNLGQGFAQLASVRTGRWTSVETGEGNGP
jgi:hypothetical protein